MTPGTLVWTVLTRNYKKNHPVFVHILVVLKKYTNEFCGWLAARKVPGVITRCQTVLIKHSEQRLVHTHTHTHWFIYLVLNEAHLATNKVPSVWHRAAEVLTGDTGLHCRLKVNKKAAVTSQGVAPTGWCRQWLRESRDVSTLWGSQWGRGAQRHRSEWSRAHVFGSETLSMRKDPRGTCTDDDITTTIPTLGDIFRIEDECKQKWGIPLISCVRAVIDCVAF